MSKVESMSRELAAKQMHNKLLEQELHNLISATHIDPQLRGLQNFEKVLKAIPLQEMRITNPDLLS